jgi:hypothetical protein
MLARGLMGESFTRVRASGARIAGAEPFPDIVGKSGQ